MILAIVLIWLVLVLWALIKLPAAAQGLLMAAVLIVAFGWLGAAAVLAGLVAGTVAVVRSAH